MNNKTIIIDPLSTISLYLETYVNHLSLGIATGFIVEKNSKHFLITNWHVITGRNSETNQPLSPSGGLPDTLKIVLHSSSRLGTWQIREEKLFDKSGNKKWIEHPKAKSIDIIALPLTCIDGNIKVYPCDLTLANADIVPQPAMAVSIIGFPLGITAAGVFPIWKTGHIASDPDLDYDDRPAFLIDATTRGGMSGSPVILRSSGGYMNSTGAQIIAGSTINKFLGIYSGRIRENIEIGMVWRPYLIDEILHNE